MSTPTTQRPAEGEKLRITSYIDSDSHVEEPDACWNYLDAEFAHRRPRILNLRGEPGLPTQDAYWIIDGRQHPRPLGESPTYYGSPPVSTMALRKAYSVPSQSLEDVAVRLADMDRNKIKLSVLFPTVFLAHLTDDPRFEAALMRSYNTWLAERCGLSGGRLKYVALLPLRSPNDAVAEVRRAKELGAVGLYTMGTAGEMMLNDRRLDPVWEEAVKQDMPLCIHIGYSHPGILASCDSVYIGIATAVLLPIFMAFAAITGGGVLDRHPRLKVGFFEAGGDWLPYMVRRMGHYHPVVKQIFNLPVPKKTPAEYFMERRIYFSVEGHEPHLAEVIETVGEDCVFASADMPHAEGRESELEEMVERTDLPAGLRDKILSANTLRFYGLPA